MKPEVQLKVSLGLFWACVWPSRFLVTYENLPAHFSPHVSRSSQAVSSKSYPDCFSLSPSSFALGMLQLRQNKVLVPVLEEAVTQVITFSHNSLRLGLYCSLDTISLHQEYSCHPHCLCSAAEWKLVRSQLKTS